MCEFFPTPWQSGPATFILMRRRARPARPVAWGRSPIPSPSAGAAHERRLLGSSEPPISAVARRRLFRSTVPSNALSRRGGGNKLGSLAQAARYKQLNVARNILLFIGITSILVNAVLMYLARDNVKKEIDKEVAKAGGPAAFDRAELQKIEDEAVLQVILANGVGVALGVLFVIFGLIVKRFPVPVTVISWCCTSRRTSGSACSSPRPSGAGFS